MRKRLTWLLIVLLFGAGSILVGSYIVESQTSESEEYSESQIRFFVNKDEINQALDLLARNVATALSDPEIRLFSKQKLEKILRKDRGFELKWLLTGQGYGSSILKDVVLGINIEQNIYITDPSKNEGVLKKEKFLDAISVGILNFELWDSEFVAPLVAVMPFDVRDEDLIQSIAYDSIGNAVYFDPNSKPDFPVVLLQVNDNIVRPPKVMATKAKKAKVASSSYPYYRATPYIFESQIFDIHEDGPNGPEGFAYFADAIYEKTGTLPASVGGIYCQNQNVWASNFQGPIPIWKERLQLEFTAHFWLQTSWKKYANIWGIQEVSDPSEFSFGFMKIMEDDDWINPDDYVGDAYFDCTPCKTQIFDQGLTTGWTTEDQHFGWGDIMYVRYKVFCEKIELPSAPIQVSPTNNSTVTSLNPILGWNEVNVYPEVNRYMVEVFNITKSKVVSFYNYVHGSTQIQLPTLEYNCKYRWKVVAVSDEGCGPFSPDWFFWTPSDQTLPGPPSLIYPFHNSTISALRPTFQWHSVEANPPVDIFRLMIRKVQGDVIVFNENVGNVTSFRVPAGILQNNTQYKWQVRPHNALGWGTWSGFWWFTIN